MKVLYIVTSLGLFKKNKDKFISDPYLENNFNIDNCVIASFTRLNKKDFIEDINYLDNKYCKYISNISDLLNNYHAKELSKEFWKKSLSLGFRRFLHITYDSYKIHKTNFDPKKYDFMLLKKDDYEIIKDFEEHRTVFQNTEIGFEQLFSIYIETFHSNLESLEFIKKDNYKLITNNVPAKVSVLKRFKQITFNKLFYRLFKLIFKYKQPSVLILNSYFLPKYKLELLIKSFGEIQESNFKINNRNKDFDINKRKSIFNNFQVDDEFDQYFKNILIYTFPIFFLESFEDNFRYYENKANKIKSKYIISEGWISNTSLSLFLAIAKEKYNIKHINNEHNYLEHPYLGNHNFLIAEMVDKFLTIGWKSDSKDNIIKGASLFQFKERRYKFSKENYILYISASPSVKLEEMNSAYGENQENAKKYLYFVKCFFYNLEDEIFDSLIYRGYPSRKSWLEYSKKDYIDFDRVKYIDTYKYSAKQMMMNSKLVIVDYMATSYLESLIMNIPTIVFFNTEAYFLLEDYKDIFNDLLDANICFKNAAEAAKFVNINSVSVEKWWYSEKTQSARRKFLDNNIGNPKDAISFYLSLVE